MQVTRFPPIKQSRKLETVWFLVRGTHTPTNPMTNDRLDDIGFTPTIFHPTKNPIALYTIGFGVVNTVSPSHTLNDRGDTLTQTDTHGGKTNLGVLLLHDIQ